MNRLSPLAAACCLFYFASAHAAGNAAQGRAVYQMRCAACHSPDYNGIGPAHRGVFGRAIGRAPGYDYSPALRAAQGVWDAASLDRWLADPEKFLPGQRMNVRIEDARARADVIEYLRELSGRE